MMMKVLLVLILGCFPFFLFGQNLEEVYDDAPNVILPKKERMTTAPPYPPIAEELPYIKIDACDQLEQDTRKECSDQYIKNFCKKHVIHPMPNSSYEGTVYVRFIVETNGKMTDIKVVKNQTPHKAFEAEALKVVQLLNSNHEWQPGKQNNKEVRVRIVIPVIFKLEKRW